MSWRTKLKLQGIELISKAKDRNIYALIKDSGVSLAFRVASLFLIFFLNILLTNNLSVSDYGKYAYIYSLIGIVVLFSKFGLDTSSVKLVSIYYNNGEYFFLKYFINYSSKLIGILSVIGGVLLGFFLVFYKNYSLVDAFTVLIIIICTVFIQFYQSVFRGVKKLVHALIYHPFLKNVLLIIILLISMISFELDVEKLLVAESALLVLLAFMTTLFLKKELGIQNDISEKYIESTSALKSQVSIWTKTSFPLLLVSGSHLIMKQADIVIIGNLLGEYETGIYSVASKISELGYFGISAINIAFAPYIAQSFQKGDIVYLQKIITFATVAGIVITALLISFFFLFGNAILVIHGDEYVKAYAPMAVLLLSKFASTLFGSVGVVMSMTGLQNYMLKIMIATGLLNIVLNYVLINVMGVIGAALSTSISMILFYMISSIHINRILSVNTSVFRNFWST